MIEDLLRPPPAQPVPPPQGFRPVVGQVSWAARTSRPDGLSDHSFTAAQKSGKKYEAKVVEYMQERWGDAAIEVGPWLTFSDESKTRRWCQPDILVANETGAMIFEVKSQHTPNSWFQLRQLYEPVVSHLLGVETRVCEVCPSYDPAVPFPEDIEMVAEWGPRLILPPKFCIWVLRQEYMQ